MPRDYVFFAVCRSTPYKSCATAQTLLRDGLVRRPLTQVFSLRTTSLQLLFHS
jgi:hypothetical protein